MMSLEEIMSRTVSTNLELIELLGTRSTDCAKYQKLEAFVTELFSMLRDGSIDGADVQDIALRHGVLRAKTVYESCGEHCQCAMVYDDIEAGVTCYKLNI